MRIYLETLGCRLNQAEIEGMASQLRAAGHEIVSAPEQAEMAVMNTCAVTNDAAADSRRLIRQMARAGAPNIIATGCWATLQPQQAASLPHVIQVVPNEQKDRLAEYVNSEFNIQTSKFDFELEPLSRQPLPGLHHRTRAFIKAQDGCDNHCTFCVTTLARGEARSRPLAEVLSDVQFALNGGAREIVLTGVHLGSWGQDFNAHLRDLIQAILRETDTPRLRLSSLEPWDLDADFFSLWSDARLAPHLHLPLQSGAESTLRRMARKTTPESFRGLIRAARSVIPQVAITTDLIAGFPGETESEFSETLAFVEEMNFAGGHVFTYSPRPGTGAAKMRGQVAPNLRKQRNYILRQTLDRSAQEYRAAFLGKTLRVLWEASSGVGERGWLMEGWSENYLRVRAAAPALRWNSMDNVHIAALEGECLTGEICGQLS